MNVANLQLEGLVMALASLNQLLVRKGLVSIQKAALLSRKLRT